MYFCPNLCTIFVFRFVQARWLLYSCLLCTGAVNRDVITGCCNTRDMASTEVTRHNREVLASLDVGDLVEFPRGNYSHWAVYLGEW